MCERGFRALRFRADETERSANRGAELADGLLIIHDQEPYAKVVSHRLLLCPSYSAFDHADQVTHAEGLLDVGHTSSFEDGSSFLIGRVEIGRASCRER